MREWVCGAGVMLLMLATTGAAAQPGAPPAAGDAGASVTGTWVMLLSGHQVGLELEDKSGTLEGTVFIMGQRVLVDGTIADRAFSLTSDAEIGDTQSHGATVKLTITGTHKADDTLEGEIELPRGPMTWTAERLKKP